MSKIELEKLGVLFPELPKTCGQSLDPGLREPEKWDDWSNHPTTPDQLRIENYLDRYGLKGKSILHIGSGNSLLAQRFSRRAGLITGTTVVPGEVTLGNDMALPNYRVFLHNKYIGPDRRFEQNYDFIIDNNPATFACCLSHFLKMMAFYADSLSEHGQIITDRVGLGWIVGTGEVHPRWSFSFDDWAAAGEVFGLQAYRRNANTYVLCRGEPKEPGLKPLIANLVRRVRAKLQRGPKRLLFSPQIAAATNPARDVR